MANLSDTFLTHWHGQVSVAPNLLLAAHVSRIQKVLKFIDQETEASKAKADIERIFRTPNWLLVPILFQEFVQTVGEVQFWMMAAERGVRLVRIPEQSAKTPDFRLDGVSGVAPCFEVKTLSVIDGVYNLGEINERSYKAQLSLSEQLAKGRQVAMALHEAAPHGHIKDRKYLTAIIQNLIDKAENNIKPGQYASAPTCLVLNLLLIDGYYNGNASLRPVAYGYPEEWQVRSGAYWNLAFGRPDHLVFGIVEFEGKPSVEGNLDRLGILHEHPEIQALLLIVHSLGKEPVFYGLRRQCDDDKWLDQYKSLGEAFLSLTGDNWNDDGDTMGWRLAEH